MVAYAVGEKVESYSHQCSDSQPTFWHQEEGERRVSVSQEPGPSQAADERQQMNKQDCYEVVTAWVHPR